MASDGNQVLDRGLDRELDHPAQERERTSRATSRQGNEKQRYVTMRRSRCLERHVERKSERDSKPFIAFDIETDDLGGAFLAGAYIREGEEQVQFFSSIEELLDAIFSYQNRGYIWYAHNGGEYDFKYLIEPMLERVRDGMKIKTIRQGESGRVIGFVIRYQKMRFELRDSFALLPQSLKAITRTFAPNYLKLDIGLAEGVTFNPADPTHRAYLEMDVRGLLASLVSFRQTLRELFSVPLAWTIGACSMNVFRQMLSEEEHYWRQTDAIEAFIRKCYYGGYVFLRSTNTTEDCESVDVNSMYPSVMRDYGVPVGKAMYTRRELEGKPGFYRVIAHVPDNGRMTCVPYRTKSGTTWPTGDFETYLYTADMQIAREMGATFDIIEGYVFESVDHIFTRFVEQCERVRIEQKGTALEAVVKLLQNSLYGKFGSKKETTAYLIANEWEAGTIPYTDPHTGLPSDHLFLKQESVDQPYLHIEWAAAITSHARMRLFTYIRAIGEEQVIYGDTDSITGHRAAVEHAIATGALPVGVEYGKVKVEHQYVTFRAGGPKNYQGVTQDGVTIDKAKGIPKRALRSDEHARALDGELVVVSFTSMNSTTAILKDGEKPFAEKRTRAYSRLVNSASWWEDSEGKVHPIRVTIEEDTPSSALA